MPGQFEQLQQVEHRLNMAVCEHSPNPRLPVFAPVGTADCHGNIFASWVGALTVTGHGRPARGSLGRPAKFTLAQAPRDQEDR
jgi:hypothetical protein